MLSKQIAKHLKEVHEGGNWTVSNLKDQLADVTLEEAKTQVHDLNTILTLTYHVHYFVNTVTKVLEGGPLEGNDKLSFDHPEIDSEEHWRKFVNTVLEKAKQFSKLIEHIPEDRWWEDFQDPKYGIYFRNIIGIIEHTHYHLGQIAVIKKIIRNA